MKQLLIILQAQRIQQVQIQIKQVMNLQKRQQTQALNQPIQIQFKILKSVQVVIQDQR